MHNITQNIRQADPSGLTTIENQISRNQWQKKFFAFLRKLNSSSDLTYATFERLESKRSRLEIKKNGRY